MARRIRRRVTSLDASVSGHGLLSVLLTQPRVMYMVRWVKSVGLHQCSISDNFPPDSSSALAVPAS